MNFRLIIPMILLLSQFAAAVAQSADSGGESFNSHTVRIQDKAEGLYMQGHWERAHFIFVNELARIGDKYAQYMAGYMYLNGQGVPRDTITASAWYRLAAERGVPEFAAVRDQLIESLSQSELAQSDARYVELRKQYSDLVLALQVLRRERRFLRSDMTGSRLGGGASPVTVIVPRSGTSMTREEFLSRGDKKMQVRLNFITQRLGVAPVRANFTENEFEELAAKVDEFLGLIDDR